MSKKKIWIAVGIAVVIAGIGTVAITKGSNGFGSAPSQVSAEIEGGAKV